MVMRVVHGVAFVRMVDHVMIFFLLILALAVVEVMHRMLEMMRGRRIVMVMMVGERIPVMVVHEVRQSMVR